MGIYACAIPTKDCYSTKPKQCRFNFPHSPSPKAIIAEPYTDNDAAHTSLSEVCNNSATISDVIAKIYQAISVTRL